MHRAVHNVVLVCRSGMPGHGDAMQAVLQDAIIPQEVIVIRYAGPKGGPCMAEMLSITAAILIGKGLGGKVGLMLALMLMGITPTHSAVIRSEALY